ncbi:MAG: adenosine deaminase [Rhodobacterales bacterium]|nr:MAG: adenosine deaminase [Rhodobacterales bacterium]
MTALKVELHLHLEGAAPPEFIRQLAHEKHVDLTGLFDDAGNYVFAGFDHFLKAYEQACEVLQTPQDFYRLTRAVLERSAEHGILYTESFTSPDFCGGAQVADWRDYLAAIEEASAEAERDFGIIHRTIPTCIRHFGGEQAKQAARCAAETAGGFVTGWGMGGAELMHAPGDFAWAFDCAREAGLRITCHAGEWGGAAMVCETLDQLAPERIGHGIGAAEDRELMARLAREGIHLEVCPGSNVVLGAVSGWGTHPIARLRDAGVPVSVSTDDPPFFHTTMPREAERLAATFGWDEGDFAALNGAALDAAFCDDATKDKIAKRLEPTP